MDRGSSSFQSLVHTFTPSLAGRRLSLSPSAVPRFRLAAYLGGGSDRLALLIYNDGADDTLVVVNALQSCFNLGLQQEERKEGEQPRTAKPETFSKCQPCCESARSLCAAGFRGEGQKTRLRRRVTIRWLCSQPAPAPKTLTMVLGVEA